MKESIKIARIAILSAAAIALSGTAAMAFQRYLDPNTLPPRERAFALYGPLGDIGPTGQPAHPGCTWSRLQVPTSEGLRWMAVQDCDRDWDRE